VIESHPGCLTLCKSSPESTNFCYPHRAFSSPFLQLFEALLETNKFANSLYTHSIFDRDFLSWNGAKHHPNIQCFPSRYVIVVANKFASMTKNDSVSSYVEGMFLLGELLLQYEVKLDLFLLLF